VDYEAFIEGKAYPVLASGLEPKRIHPSLYPFQKAITEWAIRRGRAAIFADCGLGKTRMQIEWASQMAAHSLIVAPLCVAEQTIEEARQMGIRVTYCTEPKFLPGIWITNYERLKNFVPHHEYGAIVLDESSILKSLDGKTRTLLLREFTDIPYRLCCTATPAPNEIAELANHSEFIGVMSRVEMLATFFVHDDRIWRLKGHAREMFWRWMASWSLYLRQPSDLEFEDDDFILPPLTIEPLSIESNFIPDGMLFPIGKLSGITGRSEARRKTLEQRVKACAELIDAHPGQWLVWCGLNDEGRQLSQALGDEAVLIEGTDSEDARIQRHRDWKESLARVLITKPSIFGWGMNWQHCNQMAFLGLGDSYESYYQAIRRCWRFGQERPVTVWIVVSNLEEDIVRNVRRKERDARLQADETIKYMRAAELESINGSLRGQIPYDAGHAIELPSFLEAL
jgi:hypothetical protein